jgi:hypothetical protein
MLTNAVGHLGASAAAKPQKGQLWVEHGGPAV